MLHIGIDIDDTMTDTTKLANAILHSDGKHENICDYHDLNRQEFSKFCQEHFAEIQKYMMLKDGVGEVIDYLKTKNCTITIITARGAGGMEFLIPITQKFLANNHINYDNIVFSSEKKSRPCLANAINIFIDDKEQVLDEIKENCPDIMTIRFLNKDEVSKHKTIRSWFELKDYLDNFIG